MKCPKCSNVELNIIDKEGIEVNSCPDCHGMWFDFHELEEVLEKHPKEIMEANKAKTPEGYDDKKAKCPSCHGELIKVHNLEHPDVQVDQCLVCYGCWLDAGELQQLSETGKNAFISKLRDFFSI